MSKNYILNRLDNTLYDVYSLIKSEKALWKALNKKNSKLKIDSMKKFVVDKFLDFKMVDLRTVINQVQEF
jgi:hypothetical protein